MATTTELVTELQSGDVMLDRSGFEQTVRDTQEARTGHVVVRFDNGMDATYRPDELVEVNLA